MLPAGLDSRYGTQHCCVLVQNLGPKHGTRCVPAYTCPAKKRLCSTHTTRYTLHNSTGCSSEVQQQPGSTHRLPRQSAKLLQRSWASIQAPVGMLHAKPLAPGPKTCLITSEEQKFVSTAATRLTGVPDCVADCMHMHCRTCAGSCRASSPASSAVASKIHFRRIQPQNRYCKPPHMQLALRLQ